MRNGVGSKPGERHGSRSVDRARLRLLATLAELRAEVARRPLAQHQARVTLIRKDIETLATTRTELRQTIDQLATGETPFGAAAYLAARGEDLRRAQIARYQALARAEAEAAGLKETAARARARADVLHALGCSKSRY